MQKIKMTVSRVVNGISVAAGKIYSIEEPFATMVVNGDWGEAVTEKPAKPAEPEASDGKADQK